MPAFRAKGFICQNCKKLISYSPDQEGMSIACPRCGEHMTVPCGNADTFQDEGQSLATAPLMPAKRTRLFRPRLFIGLGVGLALCAALLTGLLAASAHKRPSLNADVVQQLLSPLMTPGLVTGTALTPITVRGSDISINVTQMRRTCPMIYQSAIRMTSPTESPVYCVTVVIANTGRASVPYRTWRRIESESDLHQAATLQDEAGAVLSSLSFGPETWPAGTQQHAEIQPGASLTDTLMFENKKSVSGDCLLLLPGENVGKSCKFRIRIPASMAQ